MIKNIAKSGLKGRKKDTFLLLFVVTLAFTFIVAAVLLHSSSEKTKYQQRFNMFGKWQASIMNTNSNIYQEISKKEEIPTIGLGKMIGQSDDLGYVMSVNEEVLDLGNFKLLEGKMPEAIDEIAIELNRQSYFNENINIGDMVEVSLEIPIFEKDEQDAREELDNLTNESIMGEDYLTDFYENNKEQIESIIESADYLQELFSDIEDEELKHERMIEEVIGWLMPYRETIGRNEQSLEEFDGTRVLVRTSYLYSTKLSSDENEIDNIDIIRKEGVMTSQKVILSRKMKVSGIIESYSDLWDVGDLPIGNSFITQEAGEAFLDNGFYRSQYEYLVMDIKDYEPPLNLFLYSNLSTDELMDKYSPEFKDLKRNTYAYPQKAGSTEGTLTYSIIAFVFIATVFAVFQIYLTQMGRRTRKLALLKSIGATNSQIIKMIVWEGIYILLISLPLGSFLALLLTKVLLFLMNQNKITNIVFAVNYKLLVYGLLAGLMAVMIGIMVPLLIAVRVPLTGRIAKAPKHKKSTIMKKKRQKQRSQYKGKKQNFLNISLRHIGYNKGKYLISLLLYTVTVTVLLSTILLSYIFFQDYINQVIVTDKPNYSYEVIYGMPRREINEVVDELKGIKGVTDVNVYKAGEHAYMWYEDIDKNQLYPVVKNTLPNYLINQHFGERGEEYTNINETNQYLIEDSVITNVYGISTQDSLFEKLEQSVSKGTINKEKFDAGKEVIVLMPMYWINDKLMAEPVLDRSIINNTNFKNRFKTFGAFTKAFDITYDFRYKDLYHVDQSLSPGDTLQVTIPTEDIEGEQKIMDVAFHDIKVGGILYYFPGIGMWPFSDTVESPVIIGSYSLLEKFYPKTKLGIDRHLSIEQLSRLIESFLPTKYGKTYFNIDTDGKVDNVDLFVELQRIAMEREYTFINHQENIDTVFAKAFNFTCIVGILGAVIAGIGMIILYNTTLSKVEQERDRIGILQSLGVGSKQFNVLYLMVGLLSGVIALGIAHIILIIIIYFTLDYTLWLYPWKIHFISSIVFLVFATLIYYLPIRRIIKNQPVSNIRSLSR